MRTVRKHSRLPRHQPKWPFPSKVLPPPALPMPQPVAPYQDRFGAKMWALAQGEW